MHVVFNIYEGDRCSLVSRCAAIDLVQEHVLKQGQQKNESALEQAKDRQIAGAIRHGFESITGREFPSHKKD